jgi:hypothetical protein
MKHLKHHPIEESLNETKGGTISVAFMSHPRRDKTILDICNTIGDAKYAGGVGGGGWRVVMIAVEDVAEGLKKANEVLKKYVDNGVILKDGIKKF